MDATGDGSDRARAEFEDSSLRAWQAFEEMIRTSNSLAEVRQAMTVDRSAGSPEHTYYANLDWFLANKKVPPEATLHEEALYARLLELPGVKVHFGRHDHARLVRELGAGSDPGSPR